MTCDENPIERTPAELLARPAWLPADTIRLPYYTEGQRVIDLLGVSPIAGRIIAPWIGSPWHPTVTVQWDSGLTTARDHHTLALIVQ